MNQIKTLVISLLILMFLSCSDGAQVGQKVHQLINENEIEYLIIRTEAKNGQVQNKEIKIDEKIFENQFIVSDGEFINMGRIKTMKIIGKKLEVKM